MPRRKHPDQFDLFAERPAPAEGEAARVPAPAPPPPRPSRPVADLPEDRLIDFLTLYLYAEPPAEPALPDLVAEAGKRRDGRAVPLLLRLCRRFAGHDREAPATELRLAFDALARIGDAGAGPPLVELVEKNAFGPSGTAAALGCLAALRCRQAGRLIRGAARHPEPAVRQAACLLAGALARPEELDPVLPLAKDPDRQVARAACLTLGRLGYRPAKPELEALLMRATPHDLPSVVEALVPVADNDTAVMLGRVAERCDEEGRITIASALGAIEAPGAVACLARLARDGKPGVRLAAVASLARHEPGERVARALGPLAMDPDGEVRAAAEDALKAFDAW